LGFLLISLKIESAGMHLTIPGVFVLRFKMQYAERP